MVPSESMENIFTQFCAGCPVCDAIIAAIIASNIITCYDVKH
jgi:hypothetical protein